MQLRTLLFLFTGIFAFSAWAYQNEGPYVQLSVERLVSSIGQSNDFSKKGQLPILYEDYDLRAAPWAFMFGGGYSYNLTNSINWQIGGAYFTNSAIKNAGDLNDSTGILFNYDYNTMSRGLWWVNTFHFDVLTGSWTPIQPYITVLLGVSANEAFNFSTQNLDPYAVDQTFPNRTTVSFAYGGEAGLSYQLNDLQVFSLGATYWNLGRASLGAGGATNQSLRGRNLTLMGGLISYQLQF